MLVASINLAECQNVEFIVELLPFNDKSIIYPVIKTIPGSGNINKTLLKSLNNSFNLNSYENLEKALEIAINKGLDSLSYNLFETDTTISISVSIFLNRGRTFSGWTDYYTFSKKTGKQLYLEDLFPGKDVGILHTNLLYIQNQNIQHVRANLVQKYTEGLIPQREYNVLLYLIDKRMLASYNSDDFLLSNEYLIFKNGIIFPIELSKFIPDFFRVRIEELLSGS